MLEHKGWATRQDSFLGEMALGNMFTGAYYNYLTLKNSSNGAEAYSTLIMNGTRLGLPGRGTVSKGIAGVAQDTILKSAFQNLGREGAAAAADFVGWAKAGYDAATLGYSLVECIAHR